MSRFTRHIRKRNVQATAVGLALALLVSLGISLTLTRVLSSDASAQGGTATQLSLAGKSLAQILGSGDVEGNVQLQGRANHGGVEVKLDGGIQQTASNALGDYSFADVPAGMHVLSFSFLGYLTHGIVVQVQADLTNLAPDVLLLGGDSNGNDTVELTDLIGIAGSLGTSNQASDINGDEIVNIQDLVLAGINFGKFGQVPNSTMTQRLQQVIAAMRSGPPDTVDAAIDLGMETLYGGLRPLLSPDPDTGGVVDHTKVAHQAISQAELGFAKALEELSNRDDLPPGVMARAIDLKFFIEQMNEVAEAVSRVSAQCGEGMRFDDPTSPCGDLVRLLENTRPTLLQPSYTVRLRSPVIPRNTTLAWEEDVQVTEPIALGGCETISKETRGLMVRLHFDRFTVVRDPWVNVFGAPRRTVIPIWSIEWVPSEYVKIWEMCNEQGKIVSNVSEQVRQDIPLNFFWRFIRAN